MKSQACIIGDNLENISCATKLVEKYSDDITSVIGCIDYKTLLVDLQTRRKNKKYKMVCIHKNGSTTKPLMIGMFLQEIDPEIEIVQFDTDNSLSKQLQDRTV